ncbi:MAG: 3-hydroxyacyl-CoA dehydrogenase family protein [Eubacteriales bacterium]|nr:3-hydroxyacyl-CoA dehydrogenase family protein [Eubacteriales bacterium]
MENRVVTILGANGVMGANVAGILASFGNARVYLVSRDRKDSEAAVQRAANSVRAGTIAQNLIPADYSMLDRCVAESDFVFESVSENLEIKKAVTAEIARSLRSNAFICTGTSGLSVTALAEVLPPEMRSRYFGMHFFNPPYSLTLCEIVPSLYTDPQLFGEAKKYLSEKLFRTVVAVKDSPAFLGNRIGFQFINKAMQYADAYQDNGGIDYIDAIMGPFTGRSMAPLTTSDFVGLDVHKAIVENVYENTADYAHEDFALPAFAQRLIDQGRFGRKTKSGLYRMEKLDSGLKRMMVYDINTGNYRDKMQYKFAFSEQMLNDLRSGEYRSAFHTLVHNHSKEAEICLSLLIQYVVYALFASQAVGFDPDSADDVMATGFHWCPPLAMVKALSQVADFATLVNDRLDSRLTAAVDVKSLLASIHPSKYDYRLYFQSIR